MSDAPPPRRTGLAAGIAVVLVVAVIVAVLAGRHHSSARGASSAATAATLFVGAINAGSGDGAAAISCTSFANGARSAARAGVDPGISFKLGGVVVAGDNATAQLEQDLNVGGSAQHSQYQLTLKKSGGRWLVCGQN
jgi:hypothetical protein